jgi:plasmid stability protein
MLVFPLGDAMATLYVENVPDDLYEALRARARQHRRSIAGEVLSLLEDNIPTARELRARQEFFRQVQRFQSRRARSAGPFPSSEEMQREDRSR